MTVATETGKAVSAKLIKFTYEASDFDPCRGTSRWIQPVEALLLQSNGEQAIVREYYGEVYFFLITGHDEKGKLKYLTPRNWDIELPEKGFEELREVEIPEELILQCIQFARIFPAVRKVKGLIKKLFKDINDPPKKEEIEEPF